MIITTMIMINMIIKVMTSHITKVRNQTLIGNIRLGRGITQRMVMMVFILYSERV